MVDLDKILNHLNKKIKENREALHWAEKSNHMESLSEKIEFLQNLRSALTIEEEKENEE